MPFEGSYPRGKNVPFILGYYNISSSLPPPPPRPWSGVHRRRYGTRGLRLRLQRSPELMFQLPTIFRRFFQAQGNTTTTQKHIESFQTVSHRMDTLPGAVEQPTADASE